MKSRYTVKERLILGWGKLRRFYLIRFRPDYVQASLKRRIGNCHRTGACCNLMFSCPAFRFVGQDPLCRIYRQRPDNCSFFPIDERDLRDRDIVHPEEPCGFRFIVGEQPPEPESEPAKVLIDV